MSGARKKGKALVAGVDGGAKPPLCFTSEQLPAGAWYGVWFLGANKLSRLKSNRLRLWRNPAQARRYASRHGGSVVRFNGSGTKERASILPRTTKPARPEKISKLMFARAHLCMASDLIRAAAGSATAVEGEALHEVLRDLASVRNRNASLLHLMAVDANVEVPS